MNRYQDSLNTGMDLIPALVFIGTSDMLRQIIAPDIEKQLGRKLTDWDWGYFLQENNRKAEVESRQEIAGRWRQRLADMQIIHDFVWER